MSARRVLTCSEHPGGKTRGRLWGGCWQGPCAICGKAMHRPATGRPPVTCSAACRQWRYRGRDRLL